MKSALFLVTAAGIAALSAGEALAAPKFQGDATASVGSQGELTVTFKEVGLGNTVMTEYCLGTSSVSPCNVNNGQPASITATATYVCATKQGSCPSAANKKTVSEPQYTYGGFQSDKNGVVRGSLSLAVPSAGDFSCPSGQNLMLKSVSYSNLAIEDVTNKVVGAVTPNPAAKELFTCR